jgi:hypothetical protein
MRQFFQRNRPLRAFGLRNNPLGETVVDVFGKAALLTGQLPQSAAVAESAELLELVSQAPVSIAYLFDCLTAVCLTIAIGCDVRHAQKGEFPRAYFYEIGSILREGIHTLDTRG